MHASAKGETNTHGSPFIVIVFTIRRVDPPCSTFSLCTSRILHLPISPSGVLYGDSQRRSRAWKPPLPCGAHSSQLQFV
jgi:hypothetical protein